MVILYILLFIFCLSVLIVIHELGHLTAAKIFKVYCQEFSIGFGPAIIHKRRKNGETYFSWRAIPFGGYVSMYGEADSLETEEGQSIDPSRSLLAIKKWKRAIIMFAGVFMNAVLAILVFFISNQCFQRTDSYLRNISIKEESIAYNVGLKEKDQIYLPVNDSDVNYKFISKKLGVLDNDGELTYLDNYEVEQKVKVGVALDFSKGTYSNPSYSNMISLYKVDTEGKLVLSKQVDYKNPVKLEFSIYTCKYTTETITDEKGKEVVRDTIEEGSKVAHPLSVNYKTVKNSRVLEDFGASFYMEKHWNSFPKALKLTFEDFGNSSVVIFKGIGSLFTNANTWKDLSGLVGIGVQTTTILEGFGFAKFLWIWGMISVNLAIVNLLPFPGLDGWQLLTLAIEGIFKKEIPNKAKTIVSYIGISILFALMVLVLIKDIVGLF